MAVQNAAVKPSFLYPLLSLIATVIICYNISSSFTTVEQELSSEIQRATSKILRSLPKNIFPETANSEIDPGA